MKKIISILTICFFISPFLCVVPAKAQYAGDTTINWNDIKLIEANTNTFNPNIPTQVTVDGVATGSQTTTIRTVTTGKSFYISGGYFNAVCTANAGEELLIIANGSGVQQFRLASMNAGQSTAAGVGSEADIPLIYLNPIKVPSGFKVQLITNSASCSASAMVTGYEQ